MHWFFTRSCQILSGVLAKLNLDQQIYALVFYLQLSDFGAAIVHQHNQQLSTRPFHVVGTFGYMAPEYMMYGIVDEKIDVYSYGVVLLELITGKEAIQTNQASNHESLVLWVREDDMYFNLIPKILFFHSMF